MISVVFFNLKESTILWKYICWMCKWHILAFSYISNRNLSQKTGSVPEMISSWEADPSWSDCAKQENGAQYSDRELSHHHVQTAQNPLPVGETQCLQDRREPCSQLHRTVHLAGKVIATRTFFELGIFWYLRIWACNWYEADRGQEKIISLKKRNGGGQHCVKVQDNIWYMSWKDKVWKIGLGAVQDQSTLLHFLKICN